MSEMPRTRIVIVDDSAVIRRGLGEALAADGEVEVAGVAGDGESALHQIERLKPDVVTLDVELPGMSGLQILKEIRKRWQRLPEKSFTTSPAWLKPRKIPREELRILRRLPPNSHAWPPRCAIWSAGLRADSTEALSHALGRFDSSATLARCRSPRLDPHRHTSLPVPVSFRFFAVDASRSAPAALRSFRADGRARWLRHLD